MNSTANALPERNKRSAFFIRLTNWEFWPMQVIYIPVYFYFVWLAMKSRSLLFFTASNPGIETGGMFGESKWSVLQKAPPHLIPKTVFAERNAPLEVIKKRLQENEITFPLIVKPDIGERGFLVEKIDDSAALEKYLSRYPVNFILQEYIDYAYEYNVLFNKMPGEEKGSISSITIKQYMTVTGDGISTVDELMQRDFYAVMQVERFRKDKPALMQSVPPAGETWRIEPIGNHARGTTFFDGRNMIDREMTETFNRIAAHIPDMFIFRFDVKCKTPDDLKTGKTIKIVEINGAGGEPTHIYQTGYSLFTAWGDLLRQWKIIYTASRINHSMGVPYMSFKEGLRKFRAYLDYKNKLSAAA